MQILSSVIKLPFRVLQPMPEGNMLIRSKHHFSHGLAHLMASTTRSLQNTASKCVNIKTIKKKKT